MEDELLPKYLSRCRAILENPEGRMFLGVVKHFAYDLKRCTDFFQLFEDSLLSATRNHELLVLQYPARGKQEDGTLSLTLLFSVYPRIQAHHWILAGYTKEDCHSLWAGFIAAKPLFLTEFKSRKAEDAAHEDKRFRTERNLRRYK